MFTKMCACIHSPKIKAQGWQVPWTHTKKGDDFMGHYF